MRPLDRSVAHRPACRRRSRQPAARWWCSSICRCSPAEENALGADASPAFASPVARRGADFAQRREANFALDTSLIHARRASAQTLNAFYSGAACGAGTWSNTLSRPTAQRRACPRSTISPCSAARMCMAVQNADGDWEILQFANAMLTAPNQWTLTRLLRGQAGTEGAMRARRAGARVVVLDGTALQQSASWRKRSNAAVQLSVGTARQSRSPIPPSRAALFSSGRTADGPTRLARSKPCMRQAGWTSS